MEIVNMRDKVIRSGGFLPIGDLFASKIKIADIPIRKILLFVRTYMPQHTARANGKFYVSSLTGKIFRLNSFEENLRNLKYFDDITNMIQIKELGCGFNLPSAVIMTDECKLVAAYSFSGDRIMKLTKRIASIIIPTYIRAQMRSFYILAFEYGQFKTIKNQECIDKNGEPIPWYSYPAIEYLNTLDFSEKNVFEYGGGNSTIWWAKKAKSVTTVENNSIWYNKIKEKIQKSSNVKLLFHDNRERYIYSIIEEAIPFDVVIIDGRWRGDCAKALNENVLNTHDGFAIILDNSDWYPKTARYIRERFNLIEVDFHGFAPIAGGFTTTTRIFFSRNYVNNYIAKVHSIKHIPEIATDDIFDKI